MADVNQLMQQQTESLTDRLGKLDQFYKGTMPYAENYLNNLPRPEGANPLVNYQAQDQYISGSIAKDEYDKGMQMLNTLLGFNQNKEKMDLDQKNSDRDYNLEAAKAGLKINTDGSLTVTDDPANMSDSQATAKVREILGMDIELGSSEADRGARAKTILAKLSRGEKIALLDLMNPAETTARTNASNLMNSASAIYGQVTDPITGKPINAAGVGTWGGGSKYNPFERYLGRGTDLRSAITLLTADKIKEISGAAVSDREVARLNGALPQPTDSEARIAEKTKKMANIIRVGLDMQEKAKMENLSLDQAYDKYGYEVYEKYGEPPPTWLKKNNYQSGESTTSSGNTIDLVNKYWGN
jgi:hypothetical protein